MMSSGGLKEECFLLCVLCSYGFMFIELLVVIVIIGILIGLLIFVV